MSSTSNSFYFENFSQCAALSVDAAKALNTVLNNFNPNEMLDNLAAIHKIEHNADLKQHEMVSALLRAFITPFEREDILKLSHKIDDITDSIEEIAMRLYVSDVKRIRNDAILFSELIIKATSALKVMLCELQNFKKSKKLPELVRAIMDVEEEGDKLFIRAMRELHTTSKDPLEILAWRELYHYFENCCDECEHAADMVEGIIIGNS